MLEFVKGKGWVEESNLVTMQCGTKVRIELRRPKDNEYGCWTDSDWTLSTIKLWCGSAGLRFCPKGRQAPTLYKTIWTMVPVES